MKPIADEDIALMARWLQREHVLKWYHEPEEWIREIRARKGEFDFLNHFIVCDGDTPFAFCQYYDCFYAGEDWYAIPSAGHTYSIDYLIGEAAYLGKGYGRRIVKMLVKKIGGIEGAKRIIVQPERENIPSCRSLEANGFLYDDERRYYYLELI